MSLKIKIFLLCLLALLIAGCNNDIEVGGFDVDTTVIMPLEYGNYWNYLYAQYDVDGVLEGTDYLIVRIDSVDTIDNESWYYSGNDQIKRYANKSDGLWIGEPEDLAELAIKYPAQTGDEYNWGNSHLKVMATTYLVSVPRGDYRCYRYVQTTPSEGNDSVFYYYTPGIGLVRLEYFTSISPYQSYLRYRWSLVELRIY